MLITSKRWAVIPLEQKALFKSFKYGLLALLAMFLAEYLTQFGLPEQLAFLAPFLPVIVNFLTKWAGVHKYSVTKQ